MWVRENNFIPVRITLATEQDSGGLVREEASVDYAMSPYGALLPFWTEHRELRGGKVVVENKFSYADFHKFDASSQIKFQIGHQMTRVVYLHGFASSPHSSKAQFFRRKFAGLRRPHGDSAARRRPLRRADDFRTARA